MEDVVETLSSSRSNLIFYILHFNFSECSTKGLLMSNEEALAYVHGEMTTIRDGDVTHQSIQTNLADVICGGKVIGIPNERRGGKRGGGDVE